MRILYFHQYFQTPSGNTGLRSYKMAQALIKAGYSVTVVCSSTKEGNTGINKQFNNGRRCGVVDGINVIEFDLNYSNHLNYFKRTKVFMKFMLLSIGVLFREPADIVFATSTPLTIGITGIIARWIKKKPFIFEVRDLWPELPRAMGIIKNPIILIVMKILEWISYHSANKLIALSPGILEGIASKGIKREKIEMISNGSDLNFFSQKIIPVRPKGVGKNDLMVVYSGTHGVANGLDAVLDAAYALKKRGKKNIKFILIGNGKLKLKLVERAKEENLNNIIFLDSMPKYKLTKIFAAADLGLQILKNIPAFYYGTSPNKFFDYIAAGLPVLNNYPGWLANLISKNKCGFVVEPGNPEAFAEKLIFASDNIDRLKFMGINAKNLAKNLFDIQILQKKFVKCFDEIEK